MMTKKIREEISPRPAAVSVGSLNDLEVNRGHFESQAIVAYIIVKYRNSVFNDENGILKEKDLTVTSNDLQGQSSLNRRP